MSPETATAIVVGDVDAAEEEVFESVLDRLVEFTDRIRLASLITLIGILGALYALVTGQISFEVFLGSLGVIPAGAGVLGIARNQARHGVSRDSYIETTVSADGKAVESVVRS